MNFNVLMPIIGSVLLGMGMCILYFGLPIHLLVDAIDNTRDKQSSRIIWIFSFLILMPFAVLLYGIIEKKGSIFKILTLSWFLITAGTTTYFGIFYVNHLDTFENISLNIKNELRIALNENNHKKNDLVALKKIEKRIASHKTTVSEKNRVKILASIQKLENEFQQKFSKSTFSSLTDLLDLISADGQIYQTEADNWNCLFHSRVLFDAAKLIEYVKFAESAYFPEFTSQRSPASITK